MSVDSEGGEEAKRWSYLSSSVKWHSGRSEVDNLGELPRKMAQKGVGSPAGIRQTGEILTEKKQKADGTLSQKDNGKSKLLHESQNER